MEDIECETVEGKTYQGLVVNGCLLQQFFPPMLALVELENVNSEALYPFPFTSLIKRDGCGLSRISSMVSRKTIHGLRGSDVLRLASLHPFSIKFASIMARRKVH